MFVCVPVCVCADTACHVCRYECFSCSHASWMLEKQISVTLIVRALNYHNVTGHHADTAITCRENLILYIVLAIIIILGYK